MLIQLGYFGDVAFRYEVGDFVITTEDKFFSIAKRFIPSCTLAEVIAVQNKCFWTDLECRVIQIPTPCVGNKEKYETYKDWLLKTGDSFSIHSTWVKPEKSDVVYKLVPHTDQTKYDFHNPGERSVAQTTEKLLGEQSAHLC